MVGDRSECYIFNQPSWIYNVVAFFRSEYVQTLFFTESLFQHNSELQDYYSCRININVTIKILQNSEYKSRVVGVFGWVVHGAGAYNI